MEIHVINLARSTDRRSYIAGQLESLGLPHTFFDAIDASKGQLAGICRYDEKTALWQLGHPLAPAELGCFASHYQLWKHCLALGRPIVIMEDDIKIAPGFIEALQLCHENIGQYHFIRLSALMEQRHKLVTPLGQCHRLIRYLKGPFGTQCYALTPKAASAFLAHADSWIDAVDKYVDAFWIHGVISYGLLPYHIEHGTAETPASLIGQTRSSQNRPWHRKLRRRITLLRDRLARVAFNLRQS